MSLRVEILPYVDGNNMVAPALVPPGTQSASQNNMFTSEYFMLLYMNKDYDFRMDAVDYYRRMLSCMKIDYLLQRSPLDVTGQESVDDHYALFAACKKLALPGLASHVINNLWHNWGFLNNEKSDTIKHPDGSINWNAFLIRQPQFIAAAYSAASKLGFIRRILLAPFFFWTALVIAIGGRNEPVDSTDSRRLTWHLIQSVCPESLMCRLASKIFFKRLYKDYPDGMKGVAKIYYQEGHPFAKYWVTE